MSGSNVPPKPKVWVGEYHLPHDPTAALKTYLEEVRGLAPRVLHTLRDEVLPVWTDPAKRRERFEVLNRWAERVHLTLPPGWADCGAGEDAQRQRDAYIAYFLNLAMILITTLESWAESCEAQ